jgi:hypothetical protein
MSMKPGEELANLKRLMSALKGEGSARMFIRDGKGNDLTEREIVWLEKDIRYLETVLARAKNGPQKRPA